MIRQLEKMENKFFEVQWYDYEGNDSHVTQCETIEELAQYLSRCLWGQIYGFKYNPGIFHNGKRWCLHEYTPVNEDGR